MKLLTGFIVTLLLFCAAHSAALPDELVLLNGAMLRRYSVVEWGKDTVVIKHAGGLDRVRLDNIPADVITALKASRAKPANSMSISGEVFVVTNGRTNVLLSGTEVRLYQGNIRDSIQSGLRNIVQESKTQKTYAEMQLRFAENWERFRINLATPYASTRTDAQGKFSITAPACDSYTVVVFESRMVSGDTERYIWSLPNSEIIDAAHIQLSNFNLITP